MLTEKKITYFSNGKEFHGLAVFDPSIKGKRPAVLVAHAWRGRDDFALEKARELAKWGYVGFAADVYGEARQAKDNQEAESFMLPLFIDRAELRNRIVAAYEAAKKLDEIDPEFMAAIGFCFGGLTVIELLRSGVPVKGFVVLHGILGDVLGEVKAKRPANAPRVNGKILILHGHDDPLVSQKDIDELQNELTKLQVDWQMNIYGHTKHAFTNPEAHEEKMGLIYNPEVCRRALRSTRNFLSDILDKRNNI